jgi:UPF0755 protein
MKSAVVGRVLRISGGILLSFFICFAILMLIAPHRREEAVVRIQEGSSLSSVASLLREKKIIPSARAFGLYLRLSGADRNIKAGRYRFLPGESPIAVARKIVRGETYTIKVVIPEGLTLRQTANIVERAGIIEADAFISTARDALFAAQLGIPASTCEGYLAPDTYFFEPGSEAEEIIRQMVRTFRKKLASLGVQEMNPDQLHRTVILASLVEREYRVPEDAPLIASVFLNRLEKNMPLQSCASVVYVLTEHLGRPHPSVVYYRDLAIKDDYNTYIHRGLPPGPIASPGIIALKAVLFPLKTDYLYFRLIDVQSGKHYFSRTLEEHGEAGLLAKELQD